MNFDPKKYINFTYCLLRVVFTHVFTANTTTLIWIGYKFGHQVAKLVLVAKYGTGNLKLWIIDSLADMGIDLKLQLNFCHWLIIKDEKWSPFKIDEGKRLKIFFFLESETFFWGKTKLLSAWGDVALSSLFQQNHSHWLCQKCGGQVMQCATWTLSYNIFQSLKQFSPLSQKINKWFLHTEWRF